MKRFSLFLAITMIAALLVACGGSSNKNASSASTTSAAATTTATTTASGSATANTSSATPSGQASPATTPPPNGSATPATTPAPSGSATTVAQVKGPFAYGFNAYVRGDADSADYNKHVINEITGAGFDWVRFQLSWANFEPAKDQWNPLPMDRIVQAFQGSNVKILVTLVKAPDWAVDPNHQTLLSNYQDFVAFSRFVAARYKGKIAAYEIWNEENLASEMNGEVRLGDYAKLLQAGYEGVKGGDSNAKVLFGGLTPTGVKNPKVAFDDQQYLQAFYNYSNGAYTKYFDILGVHVNATKNPPDEMYPENPGKGNWTNDPSFYFRRAEQLHQVMADNRDARPMWITEFGWTTKNEAKGYEYGAEVTEQDQANYLVGAFNWAHTHWPWVTGMFVWNLNYSTVSPPTDEKYPWSVITHDWSPRPSYTALKNMPKPGKQ